MIQMCAFGLSLARKNVEKEGLVRNEMLGSEPEQVVQVGLPQCSVVDGLFFPMSKK